MFYCVILFGKIQKWLTFQNHNFDWLEYETFIGFIVKEVKCGCLKYSSWEIVLYIVWIILNLPWGLFCELNWKAKMTFESNGFTFLHEVSTYHYFYIRYLIWDILFL